MEIYLSIKHLRDVESKILWIKYIGNIDILAGMFAGGNAILNDDKFTMGFKKLGIKLYLNEFESIDDIKMKFETNKDLIKYIYYNNIDKNAIDEQKITELDDYKALWIKNQNDNNYNLYKFKDTNFIKGLIYICDLFGFSWLSYIYGKPFDANGNTYTIPGYLENSPKNVLSYIDDYNDDENDDETIYQHKDEDD
jgi:hypothetical protein